MSVFIKNNSILGEKFIFEQKLSVILYFNSRDL